MWLLFGLCLFLGESADKKAPQKLGKRTQDWSYDFSLKHVSKGWGETCLHGTRQSPIALPEQDQLTEWKNSIPKIDWSKGRKVKIVGKATGKTLRFKGSKSDLGKITLGKEEYPLKHFDLHMGSEHTIGGKRAAMEIQFVHENPGSEHSKLILSILCDESDDKSLPTINVFMNRIAGVQDGTKKGACPGDAFGEPMELDLHTATIGQFEKADVDKLFYRYIGSETTPPCKEKVKWIIMGAQCRLDNEKILEWLRKQDSLKNNFRPTEDANGRVLYVGPTMDKENEFKWKSDKKEQQKKSANNEIKKESEDTEPKKKDQNEKSDDNKDEEKKQKDKEEKSNEKEEKGDEKEENSDEKEETKKTEGKGEDEKKDSEEKKDDTEKTDEKKDDKEKSEDNTVEKKDEKKKEESSKKADRDVKESEDSKKEDAKEDEVQSKDIEKKPQDEDEPSNAAAAAVHTHKINSQFLKPFLGGVLGIVILLMLCWIFQKRRKNEYEMLLDIEDEV